MGFSASSSYGISNPNWNDIKTKLKLGRVLYDVLKFVNRDKDMIELKKFGTEEETSGYSFELFGMKYLKELLTEDQFKKLEFSQNGYFGSCGAYLREAMKNSIGLKVTKSDIAPMRASEHYLCGLANVTIKLANELEKEYNKSELKCVELSPDDNRWLRDVYDAQKKATLHNIPKHYYISDINKIKSVY